jgi:hypothetical protein
MMGVAELVKGWGEGSKILILILGKIRAGYNENIWGRIKFWVKLFNTNLRYKCVTIYVIWSHCLSV